MQLLDAIRQNRPQRLLRYGDRKLTDIAPLLGFQQPERVSRAGEAKEQSIRSGKSGMNAKEADACVALRFSAVVTPVMHLMRRAPKVLA